MMDKTHVAMYLVMLIGIANAFDIKKMLDQHPDYSTFASLLVKTKLDDEINSRKTITVLCINNAAMSALTSKNLPLANIKNILSQHILLDYFDAAKLHDISDGTMLTTTLYQTTGQAKGNEGFLNITDAKGGKVLFGAPGEKAKDMVKLVKPVTQNPYDISVVEISAPIVSPALLAPAPSPAEVNITEILNKAGCKKFVELITSTGVIKTFESAAEKDTGFTLFAPTDEAFSPTVSAKIKKLSVSQLVSLLEYHALPDYSPPGTLKTAKDPVSTLATSGAAKYKLGFTKNGDSVTLTTGVGKSLVTNTLMDKTPVALYSVNSVLMPAEIFGKVHTPAPAPAPVEESPSPSPSPVVTSPAPAPAASPPVVDSPSPAMSPPAPPVSSPANSAASEGPVPSNDTGAASHVVFRNVVGISLAGVVSFYLFVAL